MQPRKTKEQEPAGSGASQLRQGTAVVIMAAGKGTRLKSRHPKVLHEVGGRLLLEHVIRAAMRVVAPDDIYIIVGHEAERVRKAVAATGVNFILQEPQRGTGHALMVAQKALENYSTTVVLSGDAPLITPETISYLIAFHGSKHAAMTLLSARLQNPTGYGRILRKKAGSSEVREIVEEKSANTAQRKIQEINSGIYAFNSKALFKYIGNLKTDNPHSEFYLTDMAAVLGKAKLRVLSVPTNNPHEILGANTRADLAAVDRELRMAKCHELMASGVTIVYPETCLIDSDVLVGSDTIIEPFVQILGNTRIGVDCRIRSYSVISNSVIGDGVLIRPGCVLDGAVVGASAVLGPYSHLRPESRINEGAHVGNFVETKKMVLGKNSKANHLTYLGDAEIGDDVNVGAGTITCNYDGVYKHKTVIEGGVFIGSDTTLVAPVKIAKGAYVAAASCITEDVPADSLALGRARQIIKEGWVRDKRAASTGPKK